MKLRIGDLAKATGVAKEPLIIIQTLAFFKQSVPKLIIVTMVKNKIE
ncbi:hypothetical protein AAHH67_30045 [Niallia circulans]